MTLLANLMRNSLRAGWAAVMLHKVTLRILERRDRNNAKSVEEWCRSKATNYEIWASALDSELWKEAQQFAAAQKNYAVDKLTPLGFDLGGGGAYNLLYFLVRYLRPRTVVETGVAAGFSSRAILSAMRENRTGELFSSDFPYFRLADPDQYVGYIVEPELRMNWNLLTAGDRSNLAEIVRRVEGIDLFHYDSDKSIAGRRHALTLLEGKFKPDTVIMFDDIQDNFHFRDLVLRLECPFHVFEFEGKWLGILGGPSSFHSITATAGEKKRLEAVSHC